MGASHKREFWMSLASKSEFCDGKVGIRWSVRLDSCGCPIACISGLGFGFKKTWLPRPELQRLSPTY